MQCLFEKTQGRLINSCCASSCWVGSNLSRQMTSKNISEILNQIIFEFSERREEGKKHGRRIFRVCVLTCLAKNRVMGSFHAESTYMFHHKTFTLHPCGKNENFELQRKCLFRDIPYLPQRETDPCCDI